MKRAAFFENPKRPQPETVSLGMRLPVDIFESNWLDFVVLDSPLCAGFREPGIRFHPFGLNALGSAWCLHICILPARTD